MKAIPTALLLFLFVTPLAAQMVQPDGSVLYGHEWIRPGADYLRIAVAEDGPYRIPAAQIADMGWSLTGPEADRLQLWHFGDSIPIHVTEQGVHFFGEKNRGEFDRYLFSDPDAQQLNPRYSMFTDTAVYYLGQLPVDSVGVRYEPGPEGPEDGLSEIPFIWRTAELAFDDYPVKPFTRSQGLSFRFSHFDTAEGYGSRSETDLLSSNSGTTISSADILTPGAWAGSEPAEISLRFGTGFDEHRQLVYVDNYFLDSLVVTNWAVLQRKWSVLPSLLADGQVSLRLNGIPNSRDKAILAYAQIRYPAIPTLDGVSSLQFELTSATLARVLTCDVSANSEIVFLFDQTTREWYSTSVQSERARFRLPVFTDSHRFDLVTEAGWRTPATIQNTSWAPHPEAAVDFLILTSDRFTEGSDVVDRYAAYRSSSAGGGYRVRIATVEDIYERHGYGVQRHPQAIRNYVQWLRWDHPELKYLLLMGRGREYRALRSAEQLTAAKESYFVPTFGFHGADNLLSSLGNTYTPTLATGRIPAINPEEINTYLDKLRATESQVNAPQTIAGKAWMKNIIHLGGGVNAGERSLIRSYLENAGRILTEGQFGARLNSVYKTSSDPIETSRSERIFSLINEGASLLTFFGHSTENSFDLSFDNPANYQNEAKCPLILSLGCYSGDAFRSNRSVGESFLFIPKLRGAIGFGATIGVGETGPLSILAQTYYTLADDEYYGEGIGEILRETVTKLAGTRLAEQYALQGDPAFRLHPAPGPDYTVDAQSVKFTPRVLNITNDSFTVSYDLVNLGSYRRTDTLTVQYELVLANGDRKILGTAIHPSPAARSTIVVRLPALGREAVGLNRFVIRLDPEDDLPELPTPQAEQNNVLRTPGGAEGIDYFVTANAADPVYPYQYDLVGDPQVTLTATSTNPMQKEQTYVFQLDTTPRFTTPLATHRIKQIGGVIRWQPNYTWQDSTVYYWRVSPDSTNEQRYVWESSSFTYLAGIEAGWGMGHWGQYQDGAFEQLQLDSTGAFDFRDKFINVRILNKVNEPNDHPSLIYNNENPASSVRPWRYLDEGVAVVVFEPNTANNWQNINNGPSGHPVGTYGIPTGGSRVFAFRSETTDQRANLMEFLTDVVPDGYFIFLWTNLNSYEADVHSTEWAQDSTVLSQNLFQFLEAQGASLVRRLAENSQLPYILIYEKGGEVKDEFIATEQTEVINAQFDVPQTFQQGSFVSPLIDQSRGWKRLSWRYRNNSVDDKNELVLYGVTPFDDLVLLETLPAAGARDISTYSTTQYPKLQLRWTSSDSLDRTAPQLDHLHLTYDPVADLAFDATTWSQLLPDTISRGRPYDFGVAIVNPTPYPVVDSFTVTYFRTDQQGNSVRDSARFRPLAGGDTLHYQLSFDTWQSPVNQQFFVHINPDSTVRESRYSNNLLERSVTLADDEIDPVVDITFDGVPIRDGDLVAARPLIRVDLIDENPYLLLDDPEAIELTLVDPEGQTEVVDIGDDRITFTPASETDNRASLTFTPELLQDGEYQLNVRAEDRSGNEHGRLRDREGDIKASVRFTVVNASTISRVVNYPNPFTTQTRFVYELTGSEPPQDYRIQIMTASGRIVRELGPVDLGPLKVGKHQTLAWDGTDGYGDRLANGVYLYRFVLDDNSGLNTEHRTTALDSFFQNGIGKLVILR